MMHGTLTLDGPGLVSARMENGAHIDAAISGGMAGIEVQVTNVVVHLGEQPSYRGAQTISLSMRPRALRDFLTIVAHKTGAPLFNEHQWKAIAAALREFSGARHDEMLNDGETDLMAEAIEEAYRG